MVSDFRPFLLRTYLAWPETGLLLELLSDMTQLSRDAAFISEFFFLSAYDCRKNRYSTWMGGDGWW